jgi:PhzF family phenazine biosynthesis protein
MTTWLLPETIEPLTRENGIGEALLRTRIANNGLSSQDVEGSFSRFESNTQEISMGIRISQVDAFTDRRFAGNPAAVCVLSEPADETWMQAVAGEMNLSETAFAQRLGSGSKFNLRWFTPTKEVDLCGHATLATAHILWEEGHLPPGEPALFESRSGLLTAKRGPDGIELDFPAEPVHEEVTDAGELTELRSALGAPIQFAGRNRFDLLVELETEAVVRSLRPDIRRLAQFPVRGVIVTARSNSPDYHFVSRFFAPQVGVDEDPVCGSAHCCLGPFWAEKLDRSALIAHQVSCRGGVVRVRVAGPRVVLIGQAVTVLRGELV